MRDASYLAALSAIAALGCMGCWVTGQRLLGDGGTDPAHDPGAGDAADPCLEVSCPGAEQCCAGACVSTDTDMDNCGSCLHACEADRADSCTAGQCTCNSRRECYATQKCCEGLGCRNILTDSMNCGDCGVECATGMTCMSGVCSCGGSDCPASYACCSGTCRDVRYDARNCGSCGNSCPVTGPACIDGSCVCGDDPICATCTFPDCTGLSPPGPYPACEMCCPLMGGCLPQSDENCGGCGVDCPSGTRCEPVVGPWVCTFSCEPPSTDASTDGDE